MDTGHVVFAKHLSNSPFSAAIDLAEAFMRAHPEIELWARRIDDPTDSVRRHDALEFTWTPKTPLLAELRGLLTVRPHGPPGSEFQLTCWYVTQLEETIGHVLAQSMAFHLLVEITKNADELWCRPPATPAQQQSYSSPSS